MTVLIFSALLLTVSTLAQALPSTSCELFFARTQGAVVSAETSAADVLQNLVELRSAVIEAKRDGNFALAILLREQLIKAQQEATRLRLDLSSVSGQVEATLERKERESVVAKKRLDDILQKEARFKPWRQVDSVTWPDASRIRHVTFSADHSRMLTVTINNTIRVFDLQANSAGPRKLDEWDERRVHERHALSPDGRFVTTSLPDGTLELREVGKSDVSLKLTGHDDYVSSASWDRGRTRILTASEDQTVRLWDAQSGAQVLKLRNIGAKESTPEARFIGDGTTLLVIADRAALVFDTASGQRLAKMKLRESDLLDFSISDDGQRLVTLDSNEQARIWKFGDKAPLAELALERVFSVTISADGQWVVAVTETGLIYVYDAATGRLAHEIEAQRGSHIAGARFSQDGGHLITVSRGYLNVWETVGFTKVFSHFVKGGTSEHYAISPDGTRVALEINGNQVMIFGREAPVQAP